MVLQGHPQTPTTTPLHRRVPKNPHIATATLCAVSIAPSLRVLNGAKLLLCDEGRAVRTLFVGSAAIAKVGHSHNFRYISYA